MDKHDKQFRLKRYFSVASLITVLLAAIVLGWFYRVIAIGDLKHQGEVNNITLTRAFSNAVWPQVRVFSSDIDDHGQDRGELYRMLLPHQTITENVRQLAEGTPVLKIKVFDRINIDDVFLHLTNKHIYAILTDQDLDLSVSPNFKNFLVKEQFRGR
jgi:hypothetical protein